MNKETKKMLSLNATKIRMGIIEGTHSAKAGHPGGSLSSADLFAYLYFAEMKNIDPKNPKMLGYLKIPGYSDYLHPYDENHIIGFGKDTVEIKGNPYQLGMKISLFDVTDVNNPVEKDIEKIGDRGT